MRLRALALGTLASLVFIFVGGCGSSSAPQIATVPVQGRITYQGKPLSKGSITFQPDDDGQPAHGEIQPDGTFELTTVAKGDGAVPGKHIVSVIGTEGKLVPRKFHDNKTSPVQIEVSRDKTEYPIDLR